MGDIRSYASVAKSLILVLLLVGCANRQTYEESKYQFTEPLGVRPDQAGWVMPERLEIYKVSTRKDICKICNDREPGGKGSHFTIFGQHTLTIQDRGCYNYSDDASVGRVYYLAGDQKARSHEIAHHYHGPRHENPRPRMRWPRSLRGGGYLAAGITGSRIIKSGR